MSFDKESLIQFLQDEMAIDTDDIQDDTELVSSGIIDSFSLVALISFIEKSASIRINPIDVNLNNLDTINRMLTFVESNKQGS